MTATPANRAFVFLPAAAPTNGDGEGGWTGAPVPLGAAEAEAIGGAGTTPVPLGAAGVLLERVVGKGAVLEL